MNNNLKRQYKVKPTVKQKTAFNLLKMNPKMTPTEAMRKAGYSKGSLRHPGKNLIAAVAVQQAQSGYLEVLARHNIHTERLAEIYSQLLDAKKIISTKEGFVEVPDNEIRLKTAEILKKELVLMDQKDREEKSVTMVWKKPANLNL